LLTDGQKELKHARADQGGTQRQAELFAGSPQEEGSSYQTVSEKPTQLN